MLFQACTQHRIVLVKAPTEPPVLLQFGTLTQPRGVPASPMMPLPNSATTGFLRITMHQHNLVFTQAHRTSIRPHECPGADSNTTVRAYAPTACTATKRRIHCTAIFWHQTHWELMQGGESWQGRSPPRSWRPKSKVNQSPTHRTPRTEEPSSPDTRYGPLRANCRHLFLCWEPRKDGEGRAHTEPGKEGGKNDL